MKTPLIRQGGGPDAVDEIYDDLDRARAELDKMLDLAYEDDTAQERRRRGIVGARSAAGDEHRLRGIPAIGRGVTGAIPGTRPGG